MIRTALISIALFVVSIHLHGQSLEELIAMAIANDPQVKAEYALFEAAMQNAATQGAWPDPELSLGYFISPVETRVGPQRARIGLSQMFPWFGTLRDKKNVATAQADAAYQNFLTAQVKAEFKLRSAYYPLYEVEGLLVIEEEYQELLQSAMDLATSTFSAGKGKLVDALRADIMLEMSLTRSSVLEDKRKALLTTLNLLTDRPMDEPLSILDSLVLMEDRTYSFDSILNNNHQLMTIQKRIDAAGQMVTLAEKSGRPRFGLGLDYILTDQRDGVSMPDNGKDAVVPMIKLSLPIWRRSYKARIKEAEFKRESLEHLLDGKEDELGSRYAMALFGIERAQQLHELYADQLEKERQILELLTVSYGNSGTEFEEVLRTQQEILELQKSQLETLVDQHEHYAEILFLIGR